MSKNVFLICGLFLIFLCFDKQNFLNLKQLTGGSDSKEYTCK